MRLLGSAKLQTIVEEVGPLLAGFQIAVSIVGFFGIGAVAKWILTNWFPFTRFIWSEIISFLHLPQITVEEKDTLTTLAFFAPMAVSSLYVWLGRNKTDIRDPAVARGDIRKEMRLRVYASLIGATFMVIIGGRVIQDAVTLFTTAAPDIETPEHDASPDPEMSGQHEEPLFDMRRFATFGLLVSVLIGLAVLTLVVYWLTHRSRWFASKD